MPRASVILCLLGLTGCPSIGTYQCERDEDCNREGDAGRCLADAACAYPENSGRCESGWARSPNAANSPGACIDQEPPATSGPVATTTSGPASSETTDDPSDTSGPSPSSSSTATDPQCLEGTVEIPTGTFSPGAGLDGFPLWVSLDAWEGADLLASGDNDLLISAADGTPLAYEREDRFDGRPAVWIDLPAFEADETLSLRVVVGPGLSAPDPAALWSDHYVGVWHMNDAPTGLDGDLVHNSVNEAEPGTMGGSMQPEQRIAGAVGAALEFDGLDDVVQIAASFQGSLDAYSISMWLRADEGAGESRGTPFQRLNGDFFYPRCWHQTDGSLGLACQHQVGGETSFVGSSSPLPAQTLVHIALVRDPSADRTTLYIDGEWDNDTSDQSGAVLDTEPRPRPLELGRGEWGTLLGAIDEVRVSDEVLPAERIRADFRSQSGALEVAEFGTLSPTACPL